MSDLAPLDVRVLAALPMDLGAGRWLTAGQVGERLDLAVDVARSCLARLDRRGLAEGDGARPQAFARTPAGEGEVERWAVA